MHDVPIADAKASLSELVSRARGGERFRILRRGKPVAALVGLEDLDRAEQVAQTAGFVEAARAFAQTLPPSRELPDLADLIPARPRTARRRRRSPL